MQQSLTNCHPSVIGIIMPFFENIFSWQFEIVTFVILDKTYVSANSTSPCWDCYFLVLSGLKMPKSTVSFTKGKHLNLLSIPVYTLKGTTYGAQTNLDGFFSISKVPAGAYTLLITSVGYDSIIMPLNLKAGDLITKKIFLKSPPSR